MKTTPAPTLLTIVYANDFKRIPLYPLTQYLC